MTERNIQQTSVIANTFPVPSTVNEEFLKKNVVSRNISPVKKKVEYYLNTL